eukprot:930971-Rhodomonas_salina.2
MPSILRMLPQSSTTAHATMGATQNSRGGSSRLGVDPLRPTNCASASALPAHSNVRTAPSFHGSVRPLPPLAVQPPLATRALPDLWLPIP